MTMAAVPLTCMWSLSVLVRRGLAFGGVGDCGSGPDELRDELLGLLAATISVMVRASSAPVSSRVIAQPERNSRRTWPRAVAAPTASVAATTRPRALASSATSVTRPASSACCADAGLPTSAN